MDKQNESYLNNWTNRLIEDTERDLSRELFRAMLLHSRPWNIFSSWLLLISGAIFTLIIPNLESLKNFISLSNAQLILFLLLIASLFGIAAKYLSTVIEVLFNITVTIENQFPQILKKFESEKANIESFALQNKVSVNIGIDVKRVMQPIVDQFPKIYHRFLWKAFKEGEKDILLNYKRATRYALRGSFCITIQIIFFTIAIFILAINIKSL